MNKYLKIAKNCAITHDYAPSLEYNLCAVIVRGGAILSIGYNKRMVNGLTEFYKIEDHVISTHAEVDAVLKARRKIDLTGSKIYVLRIRKGDGEIANAKPCEMCQHILFNYGIKKAIYTVDPYTSKKMKILNPAEQG